MSESQSQGREVWIEKYRPQSLDEVEGHESIVDRLSSYISQNDLPHLMFSGPAGVGKCVTGETPVLTDRGIERIESVVDDINGFEKPRDSLRVPTFDERGEFQYTEPSRVFGKQADDLVCVTTRDGSEMTVTPEHKVLVVDHDGFEWTKASELATGDRVARPRRIPLPEGNGKLDWINAMDGDRTFVHVTEAFARDHEIPAEENHVGTKKRVVAGLRKGLAIDEIAKRAETTRDTVYIYRQRVADRDLEEPSTICSLSYLRTVDASRSELKAHVTHLQYVTRHNKRSRLITPPWRVTPDLAAFIGLAVSEARLECGRIQFYNTDNGLLDRFQTAAQNVFGVDFRRGKRKDVPYLSTSNRTLTHLLESCFSVFDGATGGDGIGSSLVCANADCRAAFLRAVFDAEASISDHGILELTQKNEKFITLISYLLAGAGIPSRRKRQEKEATNGSSGPQEYHTLYISSGSTLARFKDEIGFSLSSKSERLARAAARESNPNHDTMPTQVALDTLCQRLYLCKSELINENLNPDSPGCDNYQSDIEQVIEAATEKLETAQETLEQLDRLEPRLNAIAAIPSQWCSERTLLEPIDTRHAISESVSVRSDRLLEYSDGRRTPGATRAARILTDIGAIDEPPAIETAQRELRKMVNSLNVPYNHVAEGLDLRGTEITNLLENDHDIQSLSRFPGVAERVREVASTMLSMEVIEALQTLNVFAKENLYFDRVEGVEQVSESQHVYDLTVPETRNYVAGRVPTVVHNTTCAVAIAKEIYGDEWRENFLELNASDERGIDVVRDRIKNFARSGFGGYDYRVIFLDESDALTSDAQSALRRTMEQFSHNTRFILSCNYSSQIIDPIQSRCTVFRFSPLSDEAVAEQVRKIAENEGIDIDESGMDALVYAAAGDMRKAINGLQAANIPGETVDEESVYAITSTARPEEIQEMVRLALDGDFTAARSTLETLLTEEGIAGGDIIDQLHRSIWDYDLSDRESVRVMDRIGETDYRITAGANEQVQLEALLAALALEGEEA